MQVNVEFNDQTKALQDKVGINTPVAIGNDFTVISTHYLVSLAPELVKPLNDIITTILLRISYGAMDDDALSFDYAREYLKDYLRKELKEELIKEVDEELNQVLSINPPYGPGPEQLKESEATYEFPIGFYCYKYSNNPVFVYGVVKSKVPGMLKVRVSNTDEVYNEILPSDFCSISSQSKPIGYIVDEDVVNLLYITTFGPGKYWTLGEDLKVRILEKDQVGRYSSND